MHRIRILALVAIVAACGPSDRDPASVAQRYMEGVVAGDARAAHALLAKSERAAFPLDRFTEIGYQSDIGLDRLETEVDSTAVAERSGDDAIAVVYTTGPGETGTPRTFTDTVPLVREPEPKRWYSPAIDLIREPGFWRVRLGLEQRAYMDSIANLLRSGRDLTPVELAASARAYLAAAEEHPGLARAADTDRAHRAIRAAEVAEALNFNLRIDDSAPRVFYLTGQVQNPTRVRVGILRLQVTDAQGRQTEVEIWGVDPGGEAHVGQPTRLRPGPLQVTVQSLDVMGG